MAAMPRGAPRTVPDPAGELYDQEMAKVIGRRRVSSALPVLSGPKGPLTGRPGAAAMVARAVNTIASGPNQNQVINTRDFTGRIIRGAERDVRAEGRITVRGQHFPLPVGGSGVLEPPSRLLKKSVARPDSA